MSGDARGGRGRSRREVEVSFPSAAGGRATLRLLVLERWRDRLVGLLGTRRGDVRSRPVLLAGCASIHTLGMRYELDVAFVDSRGVVRGAWRALPPGRVVSAAGAGCALERPSVEGPWPRVGDRLLVGSTA